MNKNEYKSIKEELTWLEQNPANHKWFAGRYNIMSWNLPHYERYARTEEEEKRCAEAIARFEKIREKRNKELAHEQTAKDCTQTPMPPGSRNRASPFRAKDKQLLADCHTQQWP